MCSTLTEDDQVLKYKARHSTLFHHHGRPLPAEAESGLMEDHKGTIYEFKALRRILHGTVSVPRPFPAKVGSSWGTKLHKTEQNSTVSICPRIKLYSQLAKALGHSAT